MKKYIFLYAAIGLVMAGIGALVVGMLFGKYNSEDIICGWISYLVVMLFICTGILRHTILHAGDKKRKEDGETKE